MLFYKLFQFKADLAAILKRYRCHKNVTHKFILTRIRLLTFSSLQINLLIVQIFYLNYVFFDSVKSLGSHLNTLRRIKWHAKHSNLSLTNLLSCTAFKNCTNPINQQRNLPDNLVPLRKFQIIIIIHFFKNWVALLFFPYNVVVRLNRMKSLWVINVVK